MASLRSGGTAGSDWTSEKETPMRQVIHLATTTALIVFLAAHNVAAQTSSEIWKNCRAWASARSSTCG